MILVLINYYSHFTGQMYVFFLIQHKKTQQKNPFLIQTHLFFIKTIYHKQKTQQIPLQTTKKHYYPIKTHKSHSQPQHLY